tara:strand:- start:498 stop:659 length:162 start_codon:yes stop_codon:yes gene_type:complete
LLTVLYGVFIHLLKLTSNPSYIVEIDTAIGVTIHQFQVDSLAGPLAQFEIDAL